MSVVSSLLKEFARGDVQADLKNSDGSDAGKTDTAKAKTDVGFSLMRNMINTAGGNITGSDVNDYLERAHGLNDEVESVGFAIEDEGGQIIKVYVNLQDADKFEEDMAKTLGLDDDIESAINTMAQKYDIIDVVWPEPPADGSDATSTDDLSVDSSVADFEMDDDSAAVGDALPADSDETDPKSNLLRDIDNALAADSAPPEEPPVDGEEPPVDGEESSPEDELDDSEPKDADDTVDDADHANISAATGGASDDTSNSDDAVDGAVNTGDEESEEDEMEPVLNDDGSQKLDKDGNPVMRKKRVKTEDDEVTEALKEGAKEEVEAHVKAQLSNGNKGKFYIQALKTGGSDGRKSYKVSKAGKVVHFDTSDLAEQEASRLRKVKNAPGAKASYKYEVKLAEASLLGQVMSAAAKTADVEQSDREHIATRQRRAKFVNGAKVRAKGSKNTGEIVASAGKDRVMVSFGMTPATKSEQPFNIADLELAEDYTQGADAMSIGSNFLQRIAEAADTDGIKDGLNVPLDSQQRMLVSRLKRPLEKRIVGLFAMTGIFGRLLNTPEAEDGIRAGAEFLRKNRSAKLAFDAFYTGLGKAKGMAPTVTEAKLKRGSFLQKKFETVLTALGLPGELVATDGPGVIAPVLFKTTKIIDSDGALRTALNKLALRLGVSSSDANEPVQEDLDEEVNVGNDDFFEGVVALAMALGIPEKNLQFQRPTLMSSLRAKKLALTNRGMIMQRMMALTQMLQKATRQSPTVKAEEPAKVAEALLAEGLLMEAFGDLEAITDSELKKYSVLEPNGGPAMEASYEGGGNHEDTKMIIGVDPDRDDQKNLAVEIASPWDGIIHRKNFTNDKAGYKAAMDYANILRTTNLKTGGRPRGWKEEKTGAAE